VYCEFSVGNALQGMGNKTYIYVPVQETAEQLVLRPQGYNKEAHVVCVSDVLRNRWGHNGLLMMQ